MTALSDYLEAELLDHIFNAAFTTPANDTFVSLHTAATADDGSGTECTGGSYARKEVNPNGGSSPTWDLAAADAPGHTVDNTHDIVFATATASWGTVTHTAVWDAITAGNMLVHGALTASKAVGSGDTFQFDAGDYDVTLS